MRCEIVSIKGPFGPSRCDSFIKNVPISGFIFCHLRMLFSDLLLQRNCGSIGKVQTVIGKLNKSS